MDITLVINLINISVTFSLGFVLIFVKQFSVVKDKSYLRGKGYMSAFLIVAGMNILASILIGKYSSNEIEMLSIVSIINFITSITCIICSVFSLFDIKNILRHDIMPVILPIIVLFIVHLIMMSFFGYTRVYSLEGYINNIDSSPSLVVRTVMLLYIIALIIIFSVRYFKAHKKYREILNQYFSGDTFRFVHWIDNMFVITILLIILAILSYIDTSVIYDHIYSIAVIIFSIIYTIKFINYQSIIVARAEAIELAEDCAKDQDYQNSAVSMLDKDADFCDERSKPNTAILSPMVYEAILKDITSWSSNNEKQYLRSGITITDVSEIIGVNRRRLSLFINKHYGQNFNSWINSLRVSEVEAILSNKSKYELTLSEIAYQTGFSDLPAMSNAFKKIHKVAPSEYRAAKS